MPDKYPHFRTDTELRIGVLIWQIMCPVLLVFGTVGNVLSIIVLSRPRFRKWASTVYLIGLSTADLCVLYIGLLRQWLRYMFDKDVRDMSAFGCKIHWWLMFVAADCSVWILVAITTERLVSTLCPYKSKLLCSRRVSAVTIATIVPTSMLINCHLMYGFDRLEIVQGNVTVVIPCAPATESYEYFFDNIWVWIDLCKFSLIPSVILSGGNVCILFKLILSRRKVKSQIMPTTSEPKAPSRKDMTSNMSILLVALNFVFIISTIPVSIWFIGSPYWIPKDIPRNVQLQDPWWAFINFLYYINNSSNFILYCVTGSRFREAVRGLFLFRKIQSSIGASGNHTVQTSTF